MSRLPRLQSLELFDGKPLENPLVHEALHEYCPNFNELMIYTWATPDLDTVYAVEPVSRDPRNDAELSKQSGKVAGHLRARDKRHVSAAQHVQPF